MSTSPNLAREEGIYKSELAAPIIFAVAYFPLIFVNVFRSIRHPTYVLIMLSIFCSIRVAAFVLRAILAGSDTAGTNLNLVVAQSVLYSVGFFGLLYSAYTLVVDREKMIPHTELPGPLGVIKGLMLNAHLVRLVLTVAVALGIIGGTKASSSSPSTQADASTFRHASTYIFLVMTILLVLLTALLAKDDHSYSTDRLGGPIGKKYRLLLLLGIATLCLGREAYFAATVGNTVKQNQANIFYPIPVLFEFLAVLLFSAPGLVPSRREIKERDLVPTSSNYELNPNERYAVRQPMYR